LNTVRSNGEIAHSDSPVALNYSGMRAFPGKLAIFGRKESGDGSNPLWSAIQSQLLASLPDFRHNHAEIGRKSDILMD